MDNGTENVNKVMKETLAKFKIDHVLTSVYHPQSNAKVERFHRTLHDVLAKKVADDQQTWDLFLNQALAAIRFNISESSKFSPFFLLYNRDVVFVLTIFCNLGGNTWVKNTIRLLCKNSTSHW